MCANQFTSVTRVSRCELVLWLAADLVCVHRDLHPMLCKVIVPICLPTVELLSRIRRARVVQLLIVECVCLRISVADGALIYAWHDARGALEKIWAPTHEKTALRDAAKRRRRDASATQRLARAAHLVACGRIYPFFRDFAFQRRGTWRGYTAGRSHIHTSVHRKLFSTDQRYYLLTYLHTDWPSDSTRGPGHSKL